MDLTSFLPKLDVFPSLDGRTYDCAIWQGVELVRLAIGEDDEEGCQPRTRAALRQAALDGKITLYGRRELPPPHPPGYCGEVWTRIEGDYWRTHLLNTMATGAAWWTHDHTQQEPYVVHGFKNRYWSLLVNREELALAFPNTNAGRLSQAQVVDWCRQWIESGKGNGMDKAWLAFRSEPGHAGLSRDHVFRSAWKDAKNKR